MPPHLEEELTTACTHDIVFPIFASHLIEVCVDVLSACLVQLCAANLLGKAGDADHIRWLQVLR